MAVQATLAPFFLLVYGVVKGRRNGGPSNNKQYSKWENGSDLFSQLGKDAAADGAAAVFGIMI